MKRKIRNIVKIFTANPIYLYIGFYFGFLLISSFLRNASADETYYLNETLLMSNLIKEGSWFGNYGVGLHGFLFKLPVAIIYILIGRSSVFLSTLFNITISISTLYLFYKLLKDLFKEERYAFHSTILLSVFLHFINTSVSFNRDIPAIFTVVLFLYLFFRREKPWKIGLVFLLMLDAKEHFFLTVAPCWAIYVVIEHLFFSKNRKMIGSIKTIFLKYVQGYLPSLIWIILMFTSSLIPINMFFASITGQLEDGLAWNSSQFTSEFATENLVSKGEKRIPLLSNNLKLSESCDSDQSENIRKSQGVSESESIECSRKPVYCGIVKIVDYILSYVGKILYPRTFSFVSIPKIIVLPSIIVAFTSLLSWFKKKDRRVILPIILFLNIFILVIRASHGRYLLPVAPLFALFYIIFLDKSLNTAKIGRNILIATTVFVISGFFFESSFVKEKILFETFLLFLLWITWLYKEKAKMFSLIKSFFFIFLVSGMILTSIAYSYKIGQISTYMKYGYNSQTQLIVESLSEDEKVWVNEFTSLELIKYYREDLFLDPEWVWKLGENVPKNNMLKTFEMKVTYSFDIKDMESFKEDLLEKDINKVLLVSSTIPGEKFPQEDKLDDFLSQKWLKLTNRKSLKNKTLYIFNLEI